MTQLAVEPSIRSQPSQDGPHLSIVIPAHNEERRLGGTLSKIAGYLDTQSYRSEVVVVENGSVDRTLDVATAFAHDWPNLRVFSETRRGKGLAVRVA